MQDLYTDPQIHTIDGRGFGDGNFGLDGIECFLATHLCNPICMQLNLSPFHLSANEVGRIREDTSGTSINEKGAFLSRQFPRNTSTINQN